MPDPAPAPTPEPIPSIFGRERVLVDKLAAQLHKVASQHHPYTEPTETRRGSTFYLQLQAPDGPTGMVAKVTVELVLAACPDGGACHHSCTAGCWRVRCRGPLSGVYPDDAWPPKVVAQWGLGRV